ncbi:MAG: NAD(P)-dependent oxidoreductase [Solirubrobacteraceae bacterium]
MRILIPSTAFPESAEVLRSRLPGDEVIVDGGEADGEFDVIVPLMRRVDAAMMDRHRPRLIQQYGVGLEGVDRHAAAERGVPVGNVPAADSGNADGVGEVAVLHLLALTRRYHDSRGVLEAGRLGEPTGTALTGARIVVLGLGAVGRAVAARLQGFGAELIGVGTRDADGARDRSEQLGLAAYVPVSQLTQACAGALALIVCCVLNDDTRGLVGREVLDALGAGGPGYVVNVARGPVLDYDALHEALREHRIAGAGLDVYWNEPIDPSDPILAYNVVATPHIGGVTTSAYDAMGDQVVANIERLRRGDPVVTAS